MAIIVSIASIAFLIYVIAIYPLLLGLLARNRPRAAGAPSALPTVSVILPVYNGEAFIRAKIDTLLALDYPPDLMQILFVSDGSTDGTDELVRTYGKARVQLIRIPRGGKPRALNAGRAHATGEVLFFTDVRQALSTNALRALVSRLAEPGVGVASGELVIEPGGTAGEGPGLYWRYEVWIRSRLSRLGVLQGATGCIYAMRREYAVPLPEQTLADDVYLPLAAFFRGQRIVFEPEAKAFDYTPQLGAEFRRKVRTLAGMYQVVGAYPRLLWPGSRGWLHFLSHKMARLMLPLALLALLISSFQVPDPYRVVLLSGQAAVYGLALLDLLVPRGFPLKRVTSFARTCVVMIAAATCAAAALLVPNQRLWQPTAIRQNS
jgi:poly-beta-1,6-N-acetyl-D-glucosamine synthase